MYTLIFKNYEKIDVKGLGKFAFPNHLILKLSGIFNHAEGDNCLTSYSGKITVVDKEVYGQFIV